MKFFEKLSKFVGKNMAYLVILFAVVGWIRPVTFSWANAYVTTLLGISMFGMGMTLTEKDFEAVFKSYKDVVIAFVAQFTIMPLTAYGIAKLLNLPAELAIGIILIGCCPGGVTSNVLSYLARGNVPLSLSITALSTLMAPFLTPVLTYALAGQWIKISIFAMFISIIKVVLVPVVLGIVVRHIFKETVTKIGGIVAPLISALSVIIIAGAVVSVNSNKIIETGIIILVAVILHNTCGYVFGYLVAKFTGMSQKKRRTVAIEVGVQNSGLATTLATAHFGMYPAAAIAGVVGVVYHIFSGAIIANFWNRRPTEDELQK